MFDTAFVMIDEQARPVLIIPDDLPKGEAFLHIVDGGIDIGVDTKTCGQIRGMDDEALALLGLQDAVGLSTFRGDEGETMPDTIQYVAKVREMRFGQ